MGIDPQVDHICRKALAKDPSERWQTAAELAEAIEEVYAETVGRHHRARRALVVARGSRAALVVGDGRRRQRPPAAPRRLDAFERGLKRRRVSSRSAARRCVVLGAPARRAWFVTREPPPLTEEREPNDDVAHANKIAAGTPVTGYLGKRRRRPTTAIATCSSCRGPPASRRVVTVSRHRHAEPRHQPVGRPTAMACTARRADEGGIGEGEVLHRRAIDGPLVDHDRPDARQGSALPIENVSDPYTLHGDRRDADAGETEPNGTDADANPLEPTGELRGYLDTRGDVDMLRWTGGDGTYNIVVRADGLPLAWRIGDAVHHDGRWVPSLRELHDRIGGCPRKLEGSG